MAMSTSYPWGGIKISDMRLNNPPSSWKNDSNFQLIIKNDGETRTSTKSAFRKTDLCVTWNDEPFFFAGELTNDTHLTFIVIRVHRLTPNSTIGSCKRRVTELLKIPGPCKLDIVGKCQLIFNIEKSPDVISKVVENTSATNLPDLKVPAEASNLTDSAVDVYNDEEKTWSSFLNQFQTFMGVIDDISEISPYVKIAWSILSVIPKIIITQKNRDEKVKKLSIKLKDIYDYVTDAKRLRELTATQSKTLSVLVQQTIECAYFIRAYSTEGTVKNMAKGVSGSVDDKIQEFADKLDHLMKVLTDSVNLETSVVTLRVSDKVDELNDLTLLGEMPYDPDAGFFPKKRCSPGTRQTLINEILEWINSDASPQILVLSGQAGVGKSAVAHTIAGIFRKQNRLGSMFCFSRNYTDRRNCLFSTISRDLADSDILWRKELVNIIHNSAIRKKKDAEMQFEELIVKPSNNVKTIGSVIIIVDALDESGERRERKEILGLLLNKFSELPKNYRIIITTRPEQDIEAQLQKSNVLCKRMGDIDAEETRSDIQAYVSDRLSTLSPILDNIEKNWRSILAKRAEGLFQWAQTACGFIDTTVTLPELVEENWKTCVSSSSLSLFGLYLQVFSNQPESRYTSFKKKFKTVVGAIVTAREPLSIIALQNIFKDIGDIRAILTPFSSLFVGVHDTSTPVRPLHASLSDFFVSEKIAGETNEYFIDTSDQSLMTLACLQLINRMLCFNICHLETSHLRNRDVPDIDSRIRKAIPLHLSYSCRFWAFHLQSSLHSEEIVLEIRRLMDDNLLYFFEVLSLLKAVDRGYVSMRELVSWCDDAYSDLAADAIDAWEFGFEFSDVMMKSTPHLYLSALPFACRESFVSKKYLEAYPGLFDIDQSVGSSRQIGITQTHGSGYVAALAFSPGGRYIASGTNEGEFLVWNHVTGDRVVSEVHTIQANKYRYVSNITFSLNGKLVYCCFNDGDILVLDMETKETSIETYGETIGAECLRCAISSDGCFIVWCTEKGALLFDRRNREIVKTLDQHHLISVAFSPNGDWFALYFYLKSEMHIWNTRKQMHHAMFCCVHEGLSLNDRYIALKRDNTSESIEIRDVQTNTKVTEIPYEIGINGFRLSPDDRYILVTSARMYSIWIVSTGELISQSYVDDLTGCLGFSHDSKLIALHISKSAINIRRWDTSVDLSHDDPTEGKREVVKIWLRGIYIILQYWINDVYGRHRLQISDITTTNTILHDVELDYLKLVSVLPDQKNVRVAYVSSRGLCLWDEKGETVVDVSGSSITRLLCSDKYLIYEKKSAIKIWDSCGRKLVCGSIDFPPGIKSLLPVPGAHFAAFYDNKAEIRQCESGNRVGQTFTFESEFYFPAAFLTNRKHLICISEDSVDILDPTGAKVNSIPLMFPCNNLIWRLSLNGKYLSWIDDGQIKLFDTTTEIWLTGPSLNRPVMDFWFSDDSNCIILSSDDDRCDSWLLDIWDIQFDDIIVKTIQYPFIPENLTALALNNNCLAMSTDFSSGCSVWDLGTYGMMSTLYNSPSLTVDCPNIEGTLVSKNPAISDYALTAWKKASLPAFADVDYHDGRVLGFQGELLFWVPKKKRQQFLFPCMTHSIPHQNITRLDFSNFVHGSRWAECKSRKD